MASSEPSSFLAGRSDLGAVSELMRRHLPSPRMDAGFLDWWYLGNPSGAYVIRAARAGGEVVGASTINGCRFLLGGTEIRIGMPQNVVVVPGFRGRGLFGALYRESEADMRVLGVDTFLTFTNAASTPIFLEKFGYRRGRAPEVRLIPVNPSDFLRAGSPRRLEQVPDSHPPSLEGPARTGIVKDRAYFSWRYRGYGSAQYAVLGLLEGGGGPAGLAFTKKAKKAGVPVTLLMDLWLPPGASAGAALIQVRRYALEQRTAGVMLFSDPFLGSPAGGLMSIPLGRRFNFLVKGADVARTAELADRDISFAFGDLDFY